MKELVFQVGDIVRVREWDDMVEEFGYDNDDLELDTDIKVPFLFTREMKKFCGEIYKIKEYGYDRQCGEITYDLQKIPGKTYTENLSVRDFLFGKDMLTLIKSHKNLEEIKKIRDSLYPEEEFKEGAL